MAGFGLRHGRSTGMDGYTGNQTEYPIDTANTNPMFTGDAVALNAGYVEDIAGGTPGAVTGVPAIGVFMGWRDRGTAAQIGNNNHGFSPQWTGAAGTVEPIAIVAAPAGSYFWIKGASAGTYTQANVGSRYDLLYAVGDSRTGQSASSLGAAPAAAGMFVLNRLVDLPGNTWASDEPILEVSMILQQTTAADVAA